MKIWDKVDIIVSKISTGIDYVARFFCAMTCLLLTINAIGNRIFSSPVRGTYEYAQLMTVIILS